MRNFELPGRSPVHACRGMAATSHPLATLTAVDILRSGGNAMDAAVAAAAVLAVVEPQETGIGGDCFVLYAPEGRVPPIAFNGSGRAPKAASLDWFRERRIEAIAPTSPHAVTVPGAVDAWCRLVEDHGTRSIGELLQSAIGYAEDGHVVPARVAHEWAKCETLIQQDPTAARLFLRNGRALRCGEVHRNPDLARTLRAIADRGRAGFYEGWVADDIVTYLRGLGGLHTLEDFSEARGDYVEPISATYRGLEVYQLPPNTQGVTALAILKLLERFDLAALDPLGPQRLHLEIEAGRLAFLDRDAALGDPALSSGLADRLLSEAHVAALCARIDPQRAAVDLPPLAAGSSNTTYLCVVDRDRNAVSFINSIYHSFGSGLVSPKTGVVLQNRGTSFQLDPDHPGCIGPRRRPRHTIIPGLAAQGGRATLPFGVMGGDYQPFGHAHVLTNLIDHGCDLQEAVDLPRVFYQGGELEVECGVPAETVEGLTARGHRVVPAKEPLGGCQAIWIDWNSDVLTGASDPRKDGCALGY